MISGINGRVENKEPTRVEINCSGIIYEIFVSTRTSGKIDEGAIKFYTTHIIKEDSQTLFGFLDKQEQNIFERLIKISGVGPKVAMAILSTYSAVEFAQLTQSQDTAALQRVPGIGKKGANRIMVELSDISALIEEDKQEQDNAHLIKAKMALKSLGFKDDHIKKMLANTKSTSTEDIIKEALRKHK